MESEQHHGMIWEVAGGMSEPSQISPLVEILPFRIWRTLSMLNMCPALCQVLDGGWWWWLFFDKKKKKNALPLFKELMVLKGEQASRSELWEEFPIPALQGREGRIIRLKSKSGGASTREDRPGSYSGEERRWDEGMWFMGSSRILERSRLNLFFFFF